MGKIRDLRGKVVKLMLFVQEVMGLNMGHDVWFTSALFQRSQGGNCLSSGVHAMNNGHRWEFSVC